MRNPHEPLKPLHWPDLAARDLSWSQWLHRAAAKRWLVLLLVGVSRLSDGVLWYGLILALPWAGGTTGTACAIRMAGLGLLNLVIYKTMKRYFARPRPYVTCTSIRPCTRSLDEHSFPSGHTLHAVSFSILLALYYPHMAWPLALLTTLVALSRVVLGLHYPSDVAAGALIGLATTKLVLLLF
jgi:undecaprenyl-diphosphatase